MVNFMKYVGIVIAFLWIAFILAYSIVGAADDVLPPGPHAQVKHFQFIVDVPPHESVAMLDKLPQSDMGLGLGPVFVWTSVKTCLSVHRAGSPNNFLLRLGLTNDTEIRAEGSASLKNIGITLPAIDENPQYYFTDKRYSHRGESCSSREIFETPIHIQHSVLAGYRCANFEDYPITCRGTITVTGK